MLRSKAMILRKTLPRDRHRVSQIWKTQSYVYQCRSYLHWQGSPLSKQQLEGRMALYDIQVLWRRQARGLSHANKTGAQIRRRRT